MVAYSETTDQADDIMKIDIGNIPAKTDIKITFSYLETVSV